MKPYYYAVPRNIFGVLLWSVERFGGYCYRYCDTKERAQQLCDTLNGK